MTAAPINIGKVLNSFQYSEKNTPILYYKNTFLKKCNFKFFGEINWNSGILKIKYCKTVSYILKYLEYIWNIFGII